MREPRDEDRRHGRTLATLLNYRDGLFGPDTTEVSLALLGYEASDIRLLMSEYEPGRK